MYNPGVYKSRRYGNSDITEELKRGMSQISAIVTKAMLLRVCKCKLVTDVMKYTGII